MYISMYIYMYITGEHVIYRHHASRNSTPSWFHACTNLSRTPNASRVVNGFYYSYIYIHIFHGVKGMHTYMYICLSSPFNLPLFFHPLYFSRRRNLLIFLYFIYSLLCHPNGIFYLCNFIFQFSREYVELFLNKSGEYVYGYVNLKVY